MLVLASVFTTLILAGALVLAAVVAGLMAFHYVQARARERESGRLASFGADPAADPLAASADAPPPARTAEDIAQIRARIEALMEQQQLQTATQSQHFAQKIDELRFHMDQRDRKVDGLRHEIRHELRRHDDELGELRQQLAQALDAFWKSNPAALPDRPAPVAALPAHEPAPASPDPASLEPAPSVDLAFETPTLETPAFEAQTLETPPFAAPAFEPAVFEDVDLDAAAASLLAAAPPDEPVAVEPTADPLDVEPAAPLRPFTDAERLAEAHPLLDDTATDAASTTGLAGPTPADPTPTDPFADWPSLDDPFSLASPPAREPACAPEDAAPATRFAPMDAFFERIPGGDSADTPAPTPAHVAQTPAHVAQTPEPAPPAGAPPGAPPPEIPDGADDLTLISGIDPAIQGQLYGLGVTTLDDMARWSRADARQISAAVGVPEEIILDQWLFEAQSLLFERYQQQLLAQQGAALAL